MKKIRARLILTITVLLLGIVGCSSREIDLVEEELYFNENETLRVPTMVNKIDDTYYIVDCYNNNILYCNELASNLKNWYRIPAEFNQPHAIIGDGEYFIVVDTENNRLVTFRKDGNEFVKLEEIGEFGNRPHYGMLLDNKYYIWDGINTMYVYEMIDEKLALDCKYLIDALTGTYIRSFTHEDGLWYFPTANGKITVTDENFNVVKEYNVPSIIGGLSYIYKYGEYWYLNVFTDSNFNVEYPNLVRCKDLEELETQEYESLYNEFGLESAPYYVYYFDNAYYMAALNGKSAIYRLDVENDEIVECTQIY